MLAGRTATFVWRCEGCPATYDALGLELLLIDGSEGMRCMCGCELVEDVGDASGCKRPEPPQYLRGTELYGRLEELLDAQAVGAFAHTR